MDQSLVVKAMEAHAEDFNLRLTTIGQCAVKNRNAYDRLVKGTAHVGTAQRILTWIEKDRAARAASAA